MNGFSYISREALSLNEGGRFFNIHIRWIGAVGFYVYLLGKRFYKFRVSA